MKTIFLIDDSATMVMSLRNAFELSGFKVETANDGEQAIAKLQTGFKPDLMITDINMPKMNGIEFIRNARRMLRFNTAINRITNFCQ